MSFVLKHWIWSVSPLNYYIFKENSIICKIIYLS
jgi:hypothetical protein